MEVEEKQQPPLPQPTQEEQEQQDQKEQRPQQELQQESIFPRVQRQQLQQEVPQRHQQTKNEKQQRQPSPPPLSYSHLVQQPPQSPRRPLMQTIPEEAKPAALDSTGGMSATKSHAQAQKATSNVPPNISPDDDPDALCNACKKGDVAKVRTLVRVLTSTRKASVDRPKKGTETTPLHIAVVNGHTEVEIRVSQPSYPTDPTILLIL
jgi:hypothetical protein